MIFPEVRIVGPVNHPRLIALRTSTEAYSASFPTSRTVVMPALRRICDVFRPKRTRVPLAFDEVIGFESVLEIVFEEGDVRVGIHHAGHEPFVGEVNHLRVGGDGDTGAYVGDFLVFYQDDLICGDFSCGGVDDVAGADGDGLGPERKCEEDCDQKY